MSDGCPGCFHAPPPHSGSCSDARTTPCHVIEAELRRVINGQQRRMDGLVAALEAALSLADGLGSAYHDEGFEGVCKGGTGAYATCPNCQQRPGPIRAVLARVKSQP